MLPLVLLGLVSIDASNVTVDTSNLGRVYDGHGGLSAGASSRLLYDYADPYRSDILDYLFKPNFGAALPICKVEIGGDVQSTDGTEPSHMHTPGDSNFDRGYEWWLMKEAKARNPDVKTYVLSWGVPGWVGNGSFFSDENVAYQTSFLKGARDVHGITVDYIGVWNERPWGNTEYIKKLRASLDAAGFKDSTKIVGSDGGIPASQIAAMAADEAFSAAEPILGAHYPCAWEPQVLPASFWELTPPKTYWANEDMSTIGGDWAGGGCWGRSLNQNLVKLNATSTITWATLWGVYDSWRYFGNGLMYAFQPWSDNYTVPPAIWTSAHTTQFSAPGWRYVGTGGLLRGGGSWNAIVPPESRRQPITTRATRRTVTDAVHGSDVTIVIEKLEGACLRCRVPSTTAESVTVSLRGLGLGLGPDNTTVGTELASLVMWVTNATVSFLRVGEVAVTPQGAVTLWMARDTIVTLTTLTGQHKGRAATCSEDWSGGTMCTGTYAPFPMPYGTDYEDDAVSKMARFHADNGGSFEVRQQTDKASNNSNKVLLQAAPMYSRPCTRQPCTRGTAWVANADPITALGATDWSNYRVAVDVRPMAPPPSYAAGDRRVPLPTKEGLLTDPVADPISDGVYGGVCIRQIDQWDSGFCLLVGVGLRTREGGQTTAGHGEERSSRDSKAASVGWVLQAGTQTLARGIGTVVGSGALGNRDGSGGAAFDLEAFHRLSLAVQGQVLVASIDDDVVYNGTAIATATGATAKMMKASIAAMDVPPVGLAALRSGWAVIVDTVGVCVGGIAFHNLSTRA